MSSENGLLAEIRAERPLIHCITNYVTAGFVANGLLALGASPIMADGAREAEDIASICRGLVLNIGTLREETVPSMILAGKRAAALGRPVVFDPVGVGASAFRRETALRILREVPCTVIRGNASEIRVMAAGTDTLPEMCAPRGASAPPLASASHGVDADERSALREDNRQETAELLTRFSRETDAVVVMTGERDMIADGEAVCTVSNGHPMMGRITGSGCLLDGILAAFLAAPGGGAEPDCRAESRRAMLAAGKSVGAEPAERVPDSERRIRPTRLLRAVRAVAAEGICGELAWEQAQKAGGGTGTFLTAFLDALSLLTDEEIERRGRFEL